MLKIYEFPGLINPVRVRIAILEKGLSDQVSFVAVDVPNGEHRKVAFLAKNPNATVPVLELEDGTCISECTAITEYLDHLDGEPKLTGRTGRERAIVHMMQRRAEAGLLDALTTFFHHATPGLGPKLETYQNREWGEKSRERALDGMRYLNAVLGDHPYLAGEHFSMADITAFTALAFADFIQIDPPAGLRHLAAWREQVAARPSVVAA